MDAKIKFYASHWLKTLTCIKTIYVCEPNHCFSQVYAKVVAYA